MGVTLAHPGQSSPSWSSQSPGHCCRQEQKQVCRWPTLSWDTLICQLWYTLTSSSSLKRERRKTFLLSRPVKNVNLPHMAAQDSRILLPEPAITDRNSHGISESAGGYSASDLTQFCNCLWKDLGLHQNDLGSWRCDEGKGWFRPRCGSPEKGQNSPLCVGYTTELYQHARF